MGDEREGTDVYLWLIHVDVWQRPTQYYKAIFPQLKRKVLKNQIIIKKQKNKRKSIFPFILMPYLASVPFTPPQKSLLLLMSSYVPIQSIFISIQANRNRFLFFTLLHCFVSLILKYG